MESRPFSNPDVKDRIVRFFHKPGDPHRVVFHEIVNPNGSIYSTNVIAAAQEPEMRSDR